MLGPEDLANARFNPPLEPTQNSTAPPGCAFLTDLATHTRRAHATRKFASTRVVNDNTGVDDPASPSMEDQESWAQGSSQFRGGYGPEADRLMNGPPSDSDDSDVEMADEAHEQRAYEGTAQEYPDELVQKLDYHHFADEARQQTSCDDDNRFVCPSPKDVKVRPVQGEIQIKVNHQKRQEAPRKAVASIMTEGMELVRENDQRSMLKGHLPIYHVPTRFDSNAFKYVMHNLTKDRSKEAAIKLLRELLQQPDTSKWEEIAYNIVGDIISHCELKVDTVERAYIMHEYDRLAFVRHVFMAAYQTQLGALKTGVVTPREALRWEEMVAFARKKERNALIKMTNTEGTTSKIGYNKMRESSVVFKGNFKKLLEAFKMQFGKARSADGENADLG
jgi:hypothetical protein